MVIKSKSPRETQEIAKKLAQKIRVKSASWRIMKQTLVLALEGELGAGKTVFTQGFIKALGIKQKITSPTFVLMKPYKIPDGILYHIDAYRLKNYHDLEALGIKELINQPGNILLIEWSDRVQQIIPKKHITIHIDHLNKTTRKIEIVECN